MKYLLLFVIILTIVFDAMSDAKDDDGKKRPSHILEALMILAFLALVFVVIISNLSLLDYLLYIFLMYGVQRLLVFNIVYNLTRRPRLPLDYVGTVPVIDAIIRWMKMQPFFYLWLRFVIWLGYTISVLTIY